jgi:hypothetical protein
MFHDSGGFSVFPELLFSATAFLPPAVCLLAAMLSFGIRRSIGRIRITRFAPGNGSAFLFSFCPPFAE